MRFALPVLFMLLAPIAAGALKYLPGNDSQPLIRRDLIPLDVDAIRDLASHLATIADGPIPKSASQLRQRAQALTLSQRLQPAQLQARAIESSFLEGDQRPRPDNEDIKIARNTIIKAAGWLSRLPKDSEGYHLGQLLLDILHPIVPGSEVLKLRDIPNATKRWQGVIAPVDQFETKEEKVIANVPSIVPEPENNKKFAITALLTEVPMFTRRLEDGAPYSPGVTKTSLVITDATAPEPKEGKPSTGTPSGTLRFQPENSVKASSLYRSIQTFFKTHLEPLPTGYNLNINTNKRRCHSRSGDDIAANIAMLLDSAVSGKPLRRNTVLFARLMDDGSLGKPKNAWEFMLSFDKSKPPAGTRLIVGSGMLEEMSGLLVLKKASFFTKFEVLEASTFKEARALFYENDSLPPNLQLASDGYIEVRKKALEANSLETFLSHPAVEERLVKASNFSQKHLSAKMLAQQSIRRPAYFTGYIFAQELNRLLEPLANFKYVIDRTPKRAVKDAYKDTRDSLDPLKRLLKSQELKVLDEAADLIKELNSVGRDASTALNNEELVRKRDIENFKNKLKEFQLKLAQMYQPVPE